MVEVENKIQRYETYKDSGVEWLGEIPEHWETKKVKYLFYIGRGRVIAQTELDDNGKYPVYSSQTLNDGVLGFINTYDFDCTQITWTTDGANAGTVFLRRGKHNCTNVCGTLQPSNSSFSIEFIKYILEFATQFYKRPDTNGAKIMNAEMAEIFLTYPPLPEQTAIAKFLDDKTEKIDQAISIKEQQIALLKEHKQILIHKAVTRGLDDSVPLKDSGVEWIGEIPEHWEVKSLRYAFEFLNYKRIPLSATEREKMQGKYPYYGASGIIDYVDNYIFDEKLILIGEDGANLLSKSTPLAFVAEGKYWVNNHAHILRPKYDGFPYWAEQLSLIDYTIFISGAAQPKLSRGNLSAVKVIVPILKDLKEISSHIESTSQKIDTAISLKTQEIEKLKEYKSSLINSVVTGKVKVS